MRIPLVSISLVLLSFLVKNILLLSLGPAVVETLKSVLFGRRCQGKILLVVVCNQWIDTKHRSEDTKRGLKVSCI